MKVKVFCFIIIMLLFMPFELDAQQHLVLKGIIYGIDAQPVHGAEVFLKNHSEYGTLTDQQGSFEIDFPPAMKHDTLLITTIGYDTKVIPLSQFTPHIYLEKKSETIDEIVFELNKNITQEFSTQSLSQLEIYTNPNAQADVLNGVNALPASTNTDESATPILRGSSSNRSRVYFNGVPLYNIIKGSDLNHNIGSFSIFNTAVIDRVDLYASNPPLTLSNVSGGAIALVSQNDIKDLNNLSLTFAGGSGLFSRTSSKNNLHFQLFSNYTDLSLLKKLNQKSLDIVNTYQNIDVGLNSTITLKDHSRLKYFSQVTTENGDYNTTIFTYRDRFKNKNVRWYNVLNYDLNFDKNKLSLNGGISFTKKDTRFGNMALAESGQYIYTAIDFKRRFVNKLELQAGLNFEDLQINHQGSVPKFYYAYRPESPQEELDVQQRLRYISSYIYLKHQFNRNISVGAGLRNLQYHSIETSRYPLAFQGNFRFLSNNRQHKILVSYGNYFSYNLSDSYTEQLQTLESKQMTLEYTLDSKLIEVQLAAYHKEEKQDAVVYHENDAYDKKTVQGMDVLLRKNIGKHLQINIGNTLLKPNILIRGTKYKSFDDLAYFLKASINVMFWNNANLNLTYNTRPGTRYTPIVSGQYHPSYQGYKPIYSEINSARYKNYHLINLGLSKSIRLKSGSSVVFLGLNNVLDTKNERSFTYNADYSLKEPVYYSRRTYFMGVTLNW